MFLLNIYYWIIFWLLVLDLLLIYDQWYWLSIYGSERNFFFGMIAKIFNKTNEWTASPVAHLWD